MDNYEFHLFLKTFHFFITNSSIKSMTHIDEEVFVSTIRLQLELIVQNHEDWCILLMFNDVNDGLIINEGDLIPSYAFSIVLILLFLKHHPIEYRLKFLIGVVNA